MQTGVLKYPGGHGDDELKSVLEGLFNKPVKEIGHLESNYSSLDALFIANGFPCLSLDDDVNCFRDAPALKYMKEFADNGKVIVGIGNGFRVLCEAGLLPGRLLKNERGGFLSRYVFVKPENQSSMLTSAMTEDQVLHLPIATEFGRYDADSEVLAEMRLDGQILLRFCDHDGRISEAVNYTGSSGNIAAVCNREKNVFGIIPLPERAVDPVWNDVDGKLVLGSLLSFSG